ncbi:hypothetical protein JCM21900_002661, partial [Sporobolomyces salmonicolor]
MTDCAVEDIYREVHMRVESNGHGEDEEEVDHWPTREETSSNCYTRSLTKWTINKVQKLTERCRYNRVIHLALFNLSSSSTPRLPHPQSIYPAVKMRWNSRTRQFCQIVSHWAQIEKIQTDPKYNIKKENHLSAVGRAFPLPFARACCSTPCLPLLSAMFPAWRADRGCPAHDRSARLTPRGLPQRPQHRPLGLEKLFDYYGKTGDCPYYAAAIRLHPAGGTCYLKHQNWPQVWIDDTIEDTQALYNTRHLDKACTAWTQAQDHHTSSSTTTKSIFELLDEDDKDNINLDLDNIVRNFATTKCARINAAGQPISALDYWKRQYAAGEMNEGLTELALDIFGCP